MSFTQIIIWPFAQLLRLFYTVTGNYGVALILFALAIRLVLLPFQMKSKRGSLRMTRLAPRLKELEKKYAGNKQKYQEEVSRLYREEKINPMSGCVWGIIPLPIIIMLLTIVRQPLIYIMNLNVTQIEVLTDKLVTMGSYVTPEKAGYYEQLNIVNTFYENFGSIKELFPGATDLDFSFLGINLGAQPSWTFFTDVDWSSSAIWLPAVGLFLIPVISALLSLWQVQISQKSAPPTSADQAGTMKMMTYMSPIMSLVIGFQVPAALSLYWAAGAVLMVLQDLWLNKRFNKMMDAEDADRIERQRAHDADIERKRIETERLKLQGATQANPSTSRRKRQKQEKVKEEERQAIVNAQKKGKDDAIQPESQVGNRKYARGRAYMEARFTDSDGETEDAADANAEEAEA